MCIVCRVIDCVYARCCFCLLVCLGFDCLSACLFCVWLVGCLFVCVSVGLSRVFVCWWFSLLACLLCLLCLVCVVCVLEFVECSCTRL